MKLRILLMAGITGGIMLLAGLAHAQSSAPKGLNASDGAGNDSVIPAPTGVSASDGTFSDKVRITWSEVTGVTSSGKSDGAGNSSISYEVWREESGGGGNSTGAGNSDGGGNKIADVATTMYDDTSAEVGKTYAYRVKTKTADGTSDFSAADTGWRATSFAAVVNADFDGDGRPDPTFYQDSTGHWIVLQSAVSYTVLDLSGWLGTTGYLAAAADYDGDHKADFAVFEPASGNWVFKFSGGIFAPPYVDVPVSAFLGGSGTTPVVADYDNDGKADPAVYNAATTGWSAKLSSQNYTQVDFH